MTTIAQNSVGWLRSVKFDFTFVAGTAFVAIASGLVVVIEPKLFALVLTLDVWLLGYHHVIATYTRLCFDRESLRANKFLLFQLPPIVLVGVFASYLLIGSWTIPTIYVYWQWWHYTRQSYGVGQVYKRKAAMPFTQADWLSKAAIYVLPLWGIVHRSNQQPDTFLGWDVKTLAVPSIVETTLGIAAIAVVVWWVVERLAARRRGEFAGGHTLYMISHWVIFFVGYVLIADIDAGWLVLNVWHNAQYVLFVWLFNTNRFRDGVDPKARFLSTISQAANVWTYFMVVLLISTVIYLATSASLGSLETTVLPLTLLVYMAINFHHYIVDSRIWKVRQRPMQQTLQMKTIEDVE